MPKSASALRKNSLSFLLSANPSPGLPALEYASAIFSSIVIPGAVPFIGSWNTRPITCERLCSFIYVISSPSRIIEPESSKNVPHIALNNVDLPAPLEPTIVTKSPLFSVRLRLSSATCSLGVPLANTLTALFIFSIALSVTALSVIAFPMLPASSHSCSVHSDILFDCRY